MVNPLSVVCKIRLEVIGKKEDLQKYKYYKQFDENHFPQCFTNGHGTKAVQVKTGNRSYPLRNPVKSKKINHFFTTEGDPKHNSQPCFSAYAATDVSLIRNDNQ
jgi:hypothetical protein